MKRKRYLYIILVVLVLAAVTLSVPALADAGNFSGSSDWGVSSGGSWSSSDWGDSDWGGSSGGSYVFFGGGSMGWVGIVIVIIFIVVSMASKRARSSGGTGGFSSGSMASNSFSLMPIAQLAQQDPNFSEAAMREKIANLYVQMQHAWQDKEFSSMRPYMTDALYNQFNNQLNELIRSGCTNYVERIAVLEVNLSGWRQDEINDSVVAVLNTRIVDYTTRDASGELVSGSKTAEKFMCYEWTLVRSKGMKTPEPSGEGSEGTAAIHCPSCGAPLEINQSAKCPYCDTVISAKKYDWAISEIKGLSQRTVG